MPALISWISNLDLETFSSSTKMIEISKYSLRNTILSCLFKESLILACVPGFNEKIFSLIFLSLILAYFSQICFVFHKVLSKHEIPICVFLPFSSCILRHIFTQSGGQLISPFLHVEITGVQRPLWGGIALIICVTLLEEPCLLRTHFELIKERCGWHQGRIL